MNITGVQTNKDVIDKCFATFVDAGQLEDSDSGAQQCIVDGKFGPIITATMPFRRFRKVNYMYYHPKVASEL